MQKDWNLNLIVICHYNISFFISSLDQRYAIEIKNEARQYAFAHNAPTQLIHILGLLATG